MSVNPEADLHADAGGCGDAGYFKPGNEAAHREIEKDTDHGDNLRDALIDACKLRIGPPLRRHRKVSRRVRMQEAPQSNSNAEGENICR